MAGGNPTLYGYVWDTFGEVDPFGLHETLSDFDIVVRGGTYIADKFANGSGVFLDPITGRLSGISTQAKTGAELAELAIAFPHNQMGVATVGDIEKMGGQITLDGKLNSQNGTNIMNHATVDNLTSEQAEQLFNPTKKNSVSQKAKGC